MVRKNACTTAEQEPGIAKYDLQRFVRPLICTRAAQSPQKHPVESGHPRVALEMGERRGKVVADFGLFHFALASNKDRISLFD